MNRFLRDLYEADRELHLGRSFQAFISAICFALYLEGGFPTAAAIPLLTVAIYFALVLLAPQR